MALGIISVCTDKQFQESLKHVAAGLHVGTVYNVDHYISLGDAMQYTGGPDVTPVAFVSIDDNKEQGFETAEILLNHPDADFKVIMVSSSRDGDLILEVLRGDKYGFLALPSTPTEVIAAINRIVPGQPHETALAKKDGKVYVCAGVNGGAGNTTIAVNLAVSLAERGKKTLLVDQHPMLGHAGLFLNLQASARSIYGLVENAGRIDGSLLSSYILGHSSGLDVLCSPETRATTVESKPEIFKKVVAFLRTQYEYVIVDCDAGSIEAEVVFAEAHRTFYVVSAEVAPMRDLLRYAELYGRNDTKYQIIVNHEGRSAITAGHISDKVGLPVVAHFPYLSDKVAAATNAGRTISPDIRGFSEPLSALLEVIAPGEYKKKAQRAWFSWGKRG